MRLFQQLDEITWRDVPDDACQLAKCAAGPYNVIQDLLPHLPPIGGPVWYSPYEEKVTFSYPFDTDSDKVAAWHIALRQVPGVEIVEHGLFHPEPQELHVHIKQALDNKDVFGPVASAMQLKPNALNHLWGGPNPLTSTIAGGLLGAGLGYGSGWLAEQFLPEKYFEKGKLRRAGSVIGGLAGAAPGAWWGVDNMLNHPDPTQRGFGAWTSHYPWNEEQIHRASAGNRFADIKTGMEKTITKEAQELNDMWEKYADEMGSEFAPMIPVDQFNRTIWNDLRSAGGYTPPQLAAATTGIIQAASLSGGDMNYISPVDVARIGLGMGSGYASGLVLGKTLGALAGLRPEAQQTLQQTGAWAGILANVVPIVFR